ncbi:MAG: hypothetical protein U0V74_09035 [Chitinophagales bacterium]
MASQLGEFYLKRVDEYTLEGTIRSLNDKKVYDANRPTLAGYLVECWAKSAECAEGLKDGDSEEKRKRFELYKPVVDGFKYFEVPKDVWVNVVGGGVEPTAEDRGTLSIGVELPWMIDFLKIGEGMFWESYVFG